MGSSGPLNNWTPWCTQNVLIATLSIESLSERERFRIIKTAISSLDAFIASYDDDGGCDEGASYYHAAALALFGALLILEKVSGSDFDPVFKNPKIRNMAAYIEDVHIADDLYLNYADCSPKAGRLKAREYLFAKRTGNTGMMHHAAQDYKLEGYEEDDNSYNLFYKLLGLSCYNEIMKEAEKTVSFPKSPFKAFGKTQLAIYRQGDVTFAIKGGNNAESHNHNDVGSIILYKGTKPLLCDIGVETYTKTTFSALRYTLKPMQSSYHNLVNFPPFQQKDGEDYRAENVVLDENTASFDLTNAYEPGTPVEKYVRKAFFDRKSLEITIEEDIRATASPVLTLITREKPKAEDSALDFESFRIEFSSRVKSEVEVMKIEDARLRLAWPDTLYRILVTLPGSVKWKILFK